MYGPGGPKTGVPMILSLVVPIKEIVERGRDFPWPRPKSCPRCRSNRVWGHGYFGALFERFPWSGVSEALALPGLSMCYEGSSQWIL